MRVSEGQVIENSRVGIGRGIVAAAEARLKARTNGIEA